MYGFCLSTPEKLQIHKNNSAFHAKDNFVICVGAVYGVRHTPGHRCYVACGVIRIDSIGVHS